MHFVAPLFCGLLWYLLFYDIDILLMSKLPFVSDYLQLENHIVPDALVYSVPDAIWAYSLTFLFVRYAKSFFNSSLVLIIVSFACVLLPEIIQFIEPKTGVFDCNDVILMTLSFSLTLIIHHEAF